MTVLSLPRDGTFCTVPSGNTATSLGWSSTSCCWMQKERGKGLLFTESPLIRCPVHRGACSHSSLHLLPQGRTSLSAHSCRVGKSGASLQVLETILHLRKGDLHWAVPGEDNLSSLCLGDWQVAAELVFTSSRHCVFQACGSVLLFGSTRNISRKR